MPAAPASVLKQWPKAAMRMGSCFSSSTCVGGLGGVGKIRWSGRTRPQPTKAPENTLSLLSCACCLGNCRPRLQAQRGTCPDDLATWHRPHTTPPPHLVHVHAAQRHLGGAREAQGAALNRVHLPGRWRGEGAR